MTKKRSTRRVLLDGRAIELGGLDDRQRTFLADLDKMKSQSVSYFEIYRAALGPGSVALGGRNRVDRAHADSTVYLVAQDIATRAGIEQGLILAPEHDARRTAAPVDASMISVTQAADLIDITRAAVYKAIEKRTLRATHIGNVTVVNRESALTYKAARRVATPAPQPTSGPAGRARRSSGRPRRGTPAALPR